MKIQIVIFAFILTLFGCSEGYPDLGGGYKIVGEGGYTTAVVDSLNTLVISEYILDFAMDSTFIIVAQSPPDSLPKMNIFYYSDNYRKEIAAKNDIYRQFWIINRLEDASYSYDPILREGKYSNVYGPFTEEQYIEFRIKLNVSNQLKLIND